LRDCVLIFAAELFFPGHISPLGVPVLLCFFFLFLPVDRVLFFVTVAVPSTQSRSSVHNGIAPFPKHLPWSYFCISFPFFYFPPDANPSCWFPLPFDNRPPSGLPFLLFTRCEFLGPGWISFLVLRPFFFPRQGCHALSPGSTGPTGPDVVALHTFLFVLFFFLRKGTPQEVPPPQTFEDDRASTARGG